MREWSSIVPGASEDYYIVVNHFGRFGAAFVETDLDRVGHLLADLGDLGAHLEPTRSMLRLCVPKTQART